MSKRALAGGYAPTQKDGRKRSQRKAPQTPLDFALALMRDETQTPALRASMAKAVLPYLHERGEERDKAAEREPKAEPLSDLELARRIAHILTRAEKAATRSEREGTPSRSVSSTAPQAPRVNAEQPQPMPSTPTWRDDEDAPVSDPFDPHPGYRWIP